MNRRVASAWPRAVAGCLAGLLLAGSLLMSGPAAFADDSLAFKISDQRITESSGLAADPDRGIYWTVNDSGESGRVFGLDSSGGVRGTLNFRADPVDMEALQYHDNVLYIADIGDNDSNRRFVTVYELSDPQPDNSTVLYHAYDFAYPDGPHDAETLLVGDDGRIYLVTKEAHAGIYEAPADASRSEVNTLTRIADAPPYVTDGTFTDDGLIALRSYVDVKIVDPNQNYKVVGRAPTPFQPQGESVTRPLDGKGLLVGSEGRDSAVFSMPVPAQVGKAPSPNSSPPPSPSPTASGSKTGQADGSADGTDVSQNSSTTPNGTLAALVVAAAVALAAAVGVYFARGRSR
jgi:hypothetical protein